MLKPKDFEEYLKRWPTGLGLILIFLPGVLYQLEYRSVNIANYSGSLVIIFLFLSLYYSMPYLILSCVSFKILFLNLKKLNKNHFLGIILGSTVAYWFMFKIESYFPTLVHQRFYFISLAIVLIILFMVLLFNKFKK